MRVEIYNGALIEHDALKGWINTSLPVSVSGLVVPPDPSVSVLQLANSETGVVQKLTHRTCS